MSADHAAVIREHIMVCEPLTRLEREVLAALDALVAERDEANYEMEQLRRLAAESYDRAEAAEAQVVALREALEQIVEWNCPEGSGGAGFAHVRWVARAALAGLREKM